jgi:hypothetical protein
VRRLPILLLLLVCSCDRESPRKVAREPSISRPDPVIAEPVKTESPDLSIYRPAVAAYLANARALAKMVREGTGLAVYTKALDDAEELYGRIPYIARGAEDVDRALRALRKAANDCQEALARYDRSVAIERGMNRLDRKGDFALHIERMARERENEFERLHHICATMRARIEQVEFLLSQHL